MTAARRIPGDDAMAELAAVVGEAAAGELARRFGGTGLYVPRTIGDSHPIAAAVGGEIAAALAGWAGGSTLTIPKQPARRAQVLDLHRRSSLTVRQIARQLSYSERQVHRILRDAEDHAQPDLFDQ